GSGRTIEAVSLNLDGLFAHHFEPIQPRPSSEGNSERRRTVTVHQWLLPRIAEVLEPHGLQRMAYHPSPLYSRERQRGQRLQDALVARQSLVKRPAKLRERGAHARLHRAYGAADELGDLFVRKGGVLPQQK